MPKSKSTTTDSSTQLSDRAVRLTQDITGGFGNHSKGTVLDNLSDSAYNTLVQGGLGEPASSTTGEVVDASQELTATDGTGADNG